MAIATINITGEKTASAIAAHNLSNTHLNNWLTFIGLRSLFSCDISELDFLIVLSCCLLKWYFRLNT